MCTKSCKEQVTYNQILGISSVADPDPGSGAFLTPGSGIRRG
jgi:hypothetical protein